MHQRNEMLVQLALSMKYLSDGNDLRQSGFARRSQGATQMATETWQRYRLQGSPAAAGDLTDVNFEERVEQEWFTATIDRKTLKSLIKRSDFPATWHFGLWLVLLAAFGVWGWFAWGTWWALPAFLGYGILYSAADHRHHELSHGTPFKTRWINEAFFHLCAFMTLREAYYYRWSHTRHHTHTLIVGQDPEIAAPRPPFLLGIASDLFFIWDGFNQYKRLLRNASGDLTEDGKHFVPDASRGTVVTASRVYLVLTAAVLLACLWFNSILPLIYVIGPRFYGGVLSQLFNLTQHAGLSENVHDHRLNTRTVLLNPVFQFLYFNMNYHIEHHMFPMVPYHRLPQIHKMIRDQCPPPYNGLIEAYAEIIPALLHQTTDPSFQIIRVLPGHPTSPVTGPAE